MVLQPFVKVYPGTFRLEMFYLQDTEDVTTDNSNTGFKGVYSHLKIPFNMLPFLKLSDFSIPNTPSLGLCTCVVHTQEVGHIRRCLGGGCSLMYLFLDQQYSQWCHTPTRGLTEQRKHEAIMCSSQLFDDESTAYLKSEDLHSWHDVVKWLSATQQ